MSAEKRGETFVIQSDADPQRPAPLDFSTFLMGLASAALIHLGQAPHPETGKTEVDFALARESLDLLSLLREKTRGNLDADEEKLFGSLLADLRLRYVEASKH